MTSQVFTQDPDEILDYTADFTARCIRTREPATDYTAGDRIRPVPETGLQYYATTGRTGSRDVRWPTAVGGTVRDGTVTWTAETVNTASLARTIVSVVWAVDGMSRSAAVTGATESTVLLSGGVVGQQYEVTCDAAMSDGTSIVIAFEVAVQRTLLPS